MEKELNILNPDDREYYDGKLYMVGIYPGAGAELSTFYVYAGYEEEALDLVVALLDIDNTNTNLLYTTDEIEDFIFETYADEYHDYIEENPEADTFQFATDYLGYIYVDATMQGASQPYFVEGSNLRIEETNAEPIVFGEKWTDVYKQFEEIAERVGLEEPNSELEIEHQIEELYNKHKGEYAWDEAYKRWLESGSDELDESKKEESGIIYECPQCGLEFPEEDLISVDAIDIDVYNGENPEYTYCECPECEYRITIQEWKENKLVENKSSKKVERKETDKVQDLLEIGDELTEELYDEMLNYGPALTGTKADVYEELKTVGHSNLLTPELKDAIESIKTEIVHVFMIAMRPQCRIDGCDTIIVGTDKDHKIVDKKLFTMDDKSLEENKSKKEEFYNKPDEEVIIWDSEVDYYDEERVADVKANQYQDYLDDLDAEEEPQEFEEWYQEYIMNFGYEDAELIMEDLEENILPEIDKQINDNVLILSGYYGSNYPDFKSSGAGGKLFEGLDDFKNYMTGFDRVCITSTKGVIGAILSDHDGTVSGQFYTIPEGEKRLELIKAMNYEERVKEDYDEEDLENYNIEDLMETEFNEDLVYGGIEARDLTEHMELLVPIKDTFTGLTPDDPTKKTESDDIPNPTYGDDIDKIMSRYRASNNKGTLDEIANDVIAALEGNQELIDKCYGPDAEFNQDYYDLLKDVCNTLNVDYDEIPDEEKGYIDEIIIKALFTNKSKKTEGKSVDKANALLTLFNEIYDGLGEMYAEDEWAEILADQYDIDAEDMEASEVILTALNKMDDSAFKEEVDNLIYGLFEDGNLEHLKDTLHIYSRNPNHRNLDQIIACLNTLKPYASNPDKIDEAIAELQAVNLDLRVTAEEFQSYLHDNYKPWTVFGTTTGPRTYVDLFEVPTEYDIVGADYFNYANRPNDMLDHIGYGWKQDGDNIVADLIGFAHSVKVGDTYATAVYDLEPVYYGYSAVINSSNKEEKFKEMAKAIMTKGKEIKDKYGLGKKTESKELLDGIDSEEYAVNIRDKSTNNFERQHGCYETYEEAVKTAKEMKLADDETYEIVKIMYDENGDELGIDCVDSKETLEESYDVVTTNNTIGEIKEDGTVIKEYCGQGLIYKNFDNYNKKSGPCYISEYQGENETGFHDRISEDELNTKNFNDMVEGEDYETYDTIQATIKELFAQAEIETTPEKMEAFARDVFEEADWQSISALANEWLENWEEYEDDEELEKNKKIEEKSNAFGIKKYAVKKDGETIDSYGGNSYYTNKDEAIEDAKNSNADSVEELVYNSEEDADNKDIPESINTIWQSNLTESKSNETITHELHTDLVPILNMNQYQAVPDELDYEREDLNEIMIEFGSPIIEEEIKSVFPSATITFGKMDNPAYYRAFSNNNDTLDFTVSVPQEEYQAKFDMAVNSDDFYKFLKETYKSYSGYVSFMADNIDDFRTQDDWKQFVTIITYFITPYARQEEFDEQVLEACLERFEPYVEDEELDESKKLNEQDYHFLTVDNADVYAEGIIIANTEMKVGKEDKLDKDATKFNVELLEKTEKQDGLYSVEVKGTLQDVCNFIAGTKVDVKEFANRTDKAIMLFDENGEPRKKTESIASTTPIVHRIEQAKRDIQAGKQVDVDAIIKELKPEILKHDGLEYDVMVEDLLELQQMAKEAKPVEKDIERESKEVKTEAQKYDMYIYEYYSDEEELNATKAYLEEQGRDTYVQQEGNEWALWVTYDQPLKDAMTEKGFDTSIDNAVWSAVCSNDINFVKNAYNKDLIKPGTRYKAFDKKHSMIMGALRNNQYEMAELLKSFGETIRKDEVEEYKSIMAKRTYEDELTKSALEETKSTTQQGICPKCGTVIENYEDMVIVDEYSKYAKPWTCTNCGTKGQEIYKAKPQDESGKGNCPNCGSSVGFGDINMDDDQITYDYECYDCGENGYAVFDLTFVKQDTKMQSENKVDKIWAKMKQAKSLDEIKELEKQLPTRWYDVGYVGSSDTNRYEISLYKKVPDGYGYTEVDIDSFIFSSEKQEENLVIPGSDEQIAQARQDSIEKGYLTEQEEIPYDNTTEKECPVCKKKYTQYPALSRRDNKTYICPDCGVAEAMEDFANYMKKNK